MYSKKMKYRIETKMTNGARRQKRDMCTGAHTRLKGGGGTGRKGAIAVPLSRNWLYFSMSCYSRVMAVCSKVLWGALCHPAMCRRRSSANATRGTKAESEEMMGWLNLHKLRAADFRGERSLL